MNNIEIVVIIVIGIMTTLIVGAMVLCDTSNDEYVYENILATVTDKYDESTTTVELISNGKTTTCVPVTSTDYYIATNQGNISVPYSEYVALKNNDTVVLTKNLNTSSLEYNCRVTS